MAAPKVIKYDSFYRGDTATFGFRFTQPYVGYDWSNVKLDTAMTNVSSPNDNNGAAAIRLNQSLTVDSSNNAYYGFQLTAIESKALTPGETYKVQAQLKENSGTNVVTPITGEVEIAQDYII
jgi:hypothetical protein